MIIYFNMLNYLWVAKHFLIEGLNVVALINIPEINEYIINEYSLNIIKLDFLFHLIFLL